jgi:hypothetical protein
MDTKHLWTILCDRCIIDAKTRNGTLVQVIDQFNIPRSLVSELADSERGEHIKRLSYRCMLVTLFRRDKPSPNPAFYRIRFKGPDGHPHERAPMEPRRIEFSQGQTRVRALAELDGYPFHEDGGTHWICVELGESEDSLNEVYQLPIDIILVDQPKN